MSGENDEALMSKPESMTNDEVGKVSFRHSRFMIPSDFGFRISSFPS
jgi:hypothetical protein